MDHNEIEKLDLVERYLMDGLTADEIDRFEEHFVTCTHCVEQLRTTDDFIKGIRLVAAEQPVTSGWFFSRIAPHYLMLASISLMLLICAGIWITSREMRLRSESNKAYEKIAQLNSIVNEQEQDVKLAKESAQSSQEELTVVKADRDNIRAQVAAQNKLIKSLRSYGSLNTDLIASIPVFSLQVTERGGLNGKPIELLKPVPPFIKMMFELEEESDLKDYCVKASNYRTKSLVVKKCGQTTTGSNIVSVFKSAAFKDGIYQFDITGLTEDGVRKDAGTYYGEITRPASRKR